MRVGNCDRSIYEVCAKQSWKLACGIALAVLTSPNALAATISFETDFVTGDGVGEIQERGISSSQILTYEEANVLFSAFPFTTPADSPSHFHLFSNVAEPETNIDLLMGSDAAGLSITSGEEFPTTFFSLTSLEIREVRSGSDVVFEGFDDNGSTGTVLFEASSTPGLVMLDEAIFGKINRASVYYSGVGLGGDAPDESGIVFDNVQIEPVPEPTTLFLSMTIGTVATMFKLRRR